MARRHPARCGLAWLMTGLIVASGCTLAQRSSIKVVDPALVDRGTALERQRQRGGFALGEHRIRRVEVREELPDPLGPLASEDVARPVQQHRSRLVMEAAGSGRTWTASCTLQRRAPASSDYRAVLDENGDEVAVRCHARAPGLPPWSFSARSVLSRNFEGQLGPDDREQTWPVEVLTRAVRFKQVPRLQRLLPVPVAQLRQNGKARLALLLGRPEKAWIDPTLPPLDAEATLALLLAVRYLPWELAE